MKALMGTLVLPSALLACDDPLALPQRIDRTRVLASRVEAVGEPSRAWPAPGQSAVVRWLVVDPDPSTRFRWDLRACVARDARVGLPSCDAAPFATVRQDEETADQPELGFMMPKQLGRVVLVQGVLCSRGQPSADGRACLGEKADGDRVVLTIPMGEEENRNPSLQDDILRLGTTAWQQPPATSTDACAAQAGTNARPAVTAGSRTSVSVELRGTDRDSLPATTPVTRETLQFSYVATEGLLEQPYAYVEASEPPGTSPPRVFWTAPTTVPAGGLIVRFYVVVRDLRGGSDWVSREVCVVRQDKE